MNYIESRKTMLNVLISFVFALIIMCIVQFQYVYAEDVKIIYIEDLKDGDILKPGDLLYGYQDYFNNYHYYGSVVDEEYLCHVDSLNFKYYDHHLGSGASHSVSGGKDTFYKIKTYQEVYNLEGHYNSWIVNFNDFNIVLSPTYIDQKAMKSEPTKENSYTLNNSSKNENNYYITQSLNSKLVKNEGWRKSTRKEYYFRNFGDMNLEDKLTLEFEFDAEEGQYLYLDYRTFLGTSGYPTHDKYTAKLNGKEIDITNSKLEQEYDCKIEGYDGTICRNYETQHDFTYQSILMKIEKSGQQKLVIEYEVLSELNTKARCDYNYGYIKNISLLTHVNSGNKLDTDDLSDGDELVCIETSDAGVEKPSCDPFIYESGNVVIEPEKKDACYTCDDELVWTNNPDKNCIKNDSINSQGKCVNNPKMGISSTTIFVLIIISATLLCVVLYKRMNKFSKI